MRQTSIKDTTRWLLLGFTLAVSVLFCLMILGYSWIVEDNIFNRMVQNEAHYIEQSFAERGEVVTPRHPFMTLYSSWSALPESVQLMRQQSPNRIEFPLPSDETIHTTMVQLSEQTWVLAANVTQYEISREYLPKLLPWMLAVVALVCVIALLLALFLSNSLVKPLQYITQTLKKTNSDRPLYFERRFKPNEIGYLAQVLQDNVNQLQLALRRETDFTRDVSHELRTPVSVLKMTVSNLTTEKRLDETSINHLQNSCAQMEQIIDILLTLARNESAQRDELPLLALIEDCLVNHGAFSRLQESALTLSVPSDYRVTANRNLLTLVFRNLLDNVTRHASKVSLTIELQGDTLLISNPVSDGVDNDIIAPGVKRQDSPGIGQGLHLIQRICYQSGWGMRVTKADGEFRLLIAFKE
ncbi:sensor histidine kinase [Aestuariibacter salexigens]|uniref:sensor histidine kinase n=1 Tax=Aestuariibacter salexigens TaxID=226010 RepID=UPI0003F5136C|nr:HAMP domain-containing sensor histidine kinase [Aestuariibacter salexigens]